MAAVDDVATLVTERLLLHPLHPRDADEMAAVLGDDRLHAFTGGQPLSVDALRHRYRRLALGRSPDGTETWLNWILRLRATNAAVGTVQATVTTAGDSQHALIAWVVGLPWQRQGIASEATLALVEWLDRCGIATISATIHPEHAASQRVASRAGLLPTADTVDGEQVWRRPVTRRADR
jgi:RimJ/RimL family protein N-acetyltransferase